ncbi:uncharacterized protein LOC129304979 [Prosopis cineraria]|uniref:uncharacterized protein LOC129304979 n=1 Tax=Prosopis cineraria TaxID=364024 RepID=UPI00240F549A|nr:uncharacterized protein LOC129304979 [Prosopis cineraria]
MGCGASVLGPEHHPNNPFHYKVARPINVEEPPKASPSPLNNDAVFSFRFMPADHDEVGVKEAMQHGPAKPPSVNVLPPTVEIERDDAFSGAASPSFREYCVHSGSSSDIEHSHDDPDMAETTDNMGNDDPILVGKSKPSRKEITNPKKESEKKERKGRRLRDVINKGRSGGKKIGIVRHRSDNIAGRLT